MQSGTESSTHQLDTHPSSSWKNDEWPETCNRRTSRCALAAVPFEAYCATLRHSQHGLRCAYLRVGALIAVPVGFALKGRPIVATTQKLDPALVERAEKVSEELRGLLPEIK